MADLFDFLGGSEAIWPGTPDLWFSPHFHHHLFSVILLFSFMTWQLLLSIVMLFLWCSDITVFGYFRDYYFQLHWHCALMLLSIAFKSNMSSLLRCMSQIPLLTYGRTYFTMICPKCQKFTLRWFVWNAKNICVGLVHFRSHTFLIIKFNLGYQSCPGYKLSLIFRKIKHV